MNWYVSKYDMNRWFVMMHLSVGAAGGGDSLNYLVLWMFIDTQNLKGQTDKDVKDAASIRLMLSVVLSRYKEISL